MKCTDGNLSVTTAIVLGGLALAASASNSRFGNVRPGSGPIAQVGNCRSYLARWGMPKVWCTSSLSYRWATPMAERIAPVAYGPRRRSTLSTVISFSYSVRARSGLDWSSSSTHSTGRPSRPFFLFSSST